MAVRVLTVGLPRMLNDIVTGTILSAGDATLVAADPEGEGGAAAQAAPDVVVCGAGASGEAEPVRLLLRWPGAAVIAIAPEDGTARLWRLTPECRDCGELSPARLLTLIRAAAEGRE